MRQAIGAWILIALCACGGGGGGSDDDGGGGDDDGPPGEDRAGCDGASFLATPTDPAADGPWDVGARTVTIGRLTVEVWYPAAPGSADGQEPAVYDIRQELPPMMRDDIPDDDNPWQPCDCVRDLPLDEAHGPYPVVLFVHGTAAFRHQSLSNATHWASRGFVVVAADHPGLMLGDFLAQLCPDDPTGDQDLSGDLDAVIAALATPAGDLAFLDGRIDATRLAVVGHSAGGGAAAAASGKPGVRVVIPLAANGSTAPADGLEQVLYMGGLSDGIAMWSGVQSAWEGSATPRALVGIANAGHLVFSDLCDTLNAEGEDLIAIANEHGLCGANFASFLFDCSPTLIDPEIGHTIVNHATSTVLESALQCRDDLPELSDIVNAYPDVAEYDEAN
jgi:pimeloyl-ACP methyl ester carboxylesterase